MHLIAVTVHGALFAALAAILNGRDESQVVSLSEAIDTSQFEPTLVESR